MTAGKLTLATGTAPAAPDSGYVSLYIGPDGKVYIKDATGTETEIGSGGAFDLDEDGIVDLAALPTASESGPGVVQLAPDGGATAGTAVQADDTRLSDSRTPTGAAGGDLTGTYPNPLVNWFAAPNALFVSPNGNNSNPGTNPQAPKLTIQAAIDAATAGDVIVLAPGAYNEAITCKDGVDLWGPNASLLLGGGSQYQLDLAGMKATIGTITRTSGGNAMILNDAAGDTSTLIVGVVDDGGSGRAIRNTVSSTMIVRGEKLYISGGGIGISDFSGAGNQHGHIRFGDAYANSNGAIIIQKANGGSLVGTIEHIVDLGYSNTLAFDCDGGTVDLSCQEIEIDTLCDIETGATLNLAVNQLEETLPRAVDGTLNLLNLDGGSILSGDLELDDITADRISASGIDVGGDSVALLRERTPQNYVHNAAAQIWQRFADPDVAETFADCDYGPDRWKVATSGTDVQCRRAPGDTQPYAIRLIQSEATARNLGLVQYWENIDCAGLQNQQVTLSVRVRCSSAVTLHGGVLQWNGTADQPSNDPWASWPATWGTDWSLAGSGSVALSANTWADLQVTMTLGTFANCGPAFWTGSTLAQNATLEFEKIKVELGSVATPFEVRPVGAELALCQRYYQVFNPGNAYFVGYMWAGLNEIYAQTVPLLVQMRVAPTVTDTNPSWSAGFPGTGNSASFYPPGSPPYVTTVGTFDILYDTSVTTLSFSYESTPDDFAGCVAGDVGRATFGTAYRAYLDSEL